MPKIVSSAGEMEMSLVSIGVDGDNIVMKGKMGVWDSKIIVTPQEATKMIGMMVNLSLIFYVLKLPFLLLKKKK
ncbi:MAG: hypothetical protein V2A69_05085 [Pseudomonadota bacterium]